MKNGHKKKNSLEIILELKEFIFCIALALVLAILINKFLIYSVTIPSESMEPTLNVEDRLFISKIYNYEKIQRGDILVFYSEEADDTYIKRVIGLPGDKIEIKLGKVYVNNEELVENYVENNDDTFSATYEVPEGKYFFLGDNREISKDSRRWINPYIDEKDIEGKAQIRIYPLNRIGFIN